MIVFVRSASIAPGKTMTTLAFAHDIASYVKDAFGVELEVSVPIGGNPNRVAWSARYADLAAFDAMNQKMQADKKYWEHVTKAADNFIPGSVNDAIWRTL